VQFHRSQAGKVTHYKRRCRESGKLKGKELMSGFAVKRR